MRHSTELSCGTNQKTSSDLKDARGKEVVLRDNFEVVLFCVHVRRCIEGEDGVRFRSRYY